MDIQSILIEKEEQYLVFILLAQLEEKYLEIANFINNNPGVMHEDPEFKDSFETIEQALVVGLPLKEKLQKNFLDHGFDISEKT